MRLVLLLLVLLVSIFSFSYFWLNKSIPVFPKLSAGIYGGELKIANEKNYNFLLISDANSDYLIQLADSASSLNIGKVHFESEQLYSVLRFRVAGKLLELTGDCEKQVCRGVVDVDDKASGSWRLKKADKSSSEKIELKLEELNRISELRSQSAEIISQIAKTKVEQQELDEQYKQYEDIVTAGAELRQVSDAKFAELQSQLRAQEQLVREKKQILAELHGKVSVALRLTSYGKIINLAREVLTLEQRLAGANQEAAKLKSPELRKKIEEGEKILDVKRQVIAEKDKIYELKQGR